MSKIVNGKNQDLVSLLGQLPIAHHFLVSEIAKSFSDLKIMYMVDNVGDFDPLSKNISPDDLRTFGIDFLIISLADHPSSVIHNEYYQELDSTGIPYLILTSYADNDSRTLYCPTWMILFPNMISGTVPTEEQARNTHRQYMFGCLNNKFKIERILLLIEIFRNPDLFKNSVVTMNSLVTEWHPEGCSEAHLRQMDFLLRDDIKEEYLNILYNQIIPALPLTHPGILLKGEDFFSCDNAAYTDSQINIVTEYGSQTAFVSEKSLKPFLAGQFFVNTSGNGTNQLLRDMGFDTYDDIIDHSRYEHNMVFPRISQLIQYLYTLRERDWTELYQQTQDRRLKNRELLLSGTIKNQFFQRLNKRIYEILR